MSDYRLLHGDWVEVLQSLPEHSVHCIVTSPPYYSLRDYGTDGQLGLEKTMEEFLDKLVSGFRECRRVLRKDGLLWVNIGDSYAGSGNGSNDYREEGASISKSDNKYGKHKTGKQQGLKPGDQCSVPERFKLAMQSDGWWCRDTIVWSKPNPMPESVKGTHWARCQVKVGTQPANFRSNHYVEQGLGVSNSDHKGTGGTTVSKYEPCPGCDKCRDNDGYVLKRGRWRCTSSFEYIYMFAPNHYYFSDGEGVKEASTWKETNPRPSGMERNAKKYRDKANLGGGGSSFNGHSGNYKSDGTPIGDLGTRNLRNVWTFPTQPTKAAHFATFPEELPRKCIKASVSEKGYCPECGEPWVRVVDSSTSFEGGSGKAGRTADEVNSTGKWAGIQYGTNLKLGPTVQTTTIGWRPTCKCRVDYTVPALVLDPFNGSGRTGVVAMELGCNYIGIDINKDYLENIAEPILGEARKRFNELRKQQVLGI